MKVKRLMTAALAAIVVISSFAATPAMAKAKQIAANTHAPHGPTFPPDPWCGKVART